MNAPSQPAAGSIAAETPEGLPLPAPNAPEPLGMGDVLRITSMRRLWYAQTVSSFGDFLALFAVISVMTFQLHANAQQVTGIQIAYLLPIAVLGILSGVFIDRWSLKVTLVSSDFIRAALCLLLLFVANIWGFYFTLAAISIFSSFFSPAQGVAIRSVVPMHGLRSANALIQQAFFIMRIVGPSSAAFLVAAFGAKSCYYLDALSFLISGCLMASLTLNLPKKSAAVGAPKPQKSAVASILHDMQQGASFILHHAGVLFVIVAMASAMFVMGCFGPLIAIYVRDTLHASTGTFGVASAMIGVGLLVGVNALNTLGKRIPNTTQVYCGLGGIAIATLLMALVHYTAATIFGCFLVGFAAAGIIVPSQTLIQQETPHELMGRVGSTNMSIIFGAQIAGLLLSGVLAEHTSVRRVFVLSSGMLGVLMLAGKLWMEPKPRQTAPVS